MTDREVTVKFKGNSSEAVRAARDTATALDNVSDSTGDADEALRKLAKALDLSEDEARALVAETKDAVEATSGLVSSARAVARQMGLSETETRQFVRALRQAEDAAEDVDDANRQTTGSTEKLGAAFKTAIAAIGVREVVEFGRELLNLTVTMEAAERRTATVFGDMAGEAEEWAERNRQAFGTSATGVLQMLSAVGDLLVPMGIARDEALLMSQDILTTANALSEWTGGTIAAVDAQDRITKAMLGERDGLVELGIKISEADVSRERARRGTEDLTGAAEAQENALITLALVQERGADALTAYAEGSGKATEASKSLTSEWQTFKETLAGTFGSTIAEIAAAGTAVLEFGGKAFELQDALDDLSESDSRFLAGLGETADMLGITKGAVEQFGDIVSTVRGDVDGLAKGQGDLVKVTQDYGVVADRLQEQLEGETAEAVRIVRGEFRAYEGTLYDVITAQASLSSPALGAANAINRLEEAQQAYQDTVADEESTSEDRERAALQLAEAQNQLTVALARVRTEGGQDAIDAMEEVLRSAGVAEEEIQRLIQALKDYNATPVANKSFSTGTGRRVGTVTARAGGGPASGLTRVGEAGEELLELPPGSFVHSASETRRITASRPAASASRTVAAGGITIHNFNVTISGSMDLSDPSTLRSIARQLKSEIETLGRGEA